MRCVSWGKHAATRVDAQAVTENSAPGWLKSCQTRAPQGWLFGGAHANGGGHGESRTVLRFREHRARRARCSLRAIRHHTGARAAAAEGLHRGEEGILRLGSLQGIQ